MTESSFDDAVVGAGILGLAHAYHLARRGRRVLVIERHPQACSASIRNFGMIWPIGQSAGPRLRLAMESRAHWLTVLQDSGLWHAQTGSLHLAYRDDEAQVLSELVADPREELRDCGLLSPLQVATRAPWVRTEGLRLALWSPTEVCVDPRLVIAGLPGWLQQRYGVQFLFGSAVLGYDTPTVRTSSGSFTAGQLIVCPGDEAHTLYPETFTAHGLIRCKLQMARSQAYGADIRIGPMLAAGLTLLHYQAFADCPSLPALKTRLQGEYPDYIRYGIHVMASQNGLGEIVIGDSHEYAEAIEPFDKPEIDTLILRYLNTFLSVPDVHITARWHGTYAKHPTQPYLVLQPAPNVTMVTGVGGAGMTLSFGLADQVVSARLGEVAHEN